MITAVASDAGEVLVDETRENAAEIRYVGDRWDDDVPGAGVRA